jgi:hypothetical protein
VDRIEFDPATGQGRVHYRVGFDGSRFDLRAAADELAVPGSKWRPHGEPPQNPPLSS